MTPPLFYVKVNVFCIKAPKLISNGMVNLTIATENKSRLTVKGHVTKCNVAETCPFKLSEICHINKPIEVRQDEV